MAKIEVVRDESATRPKFVCPACKQVIVVSMAAYEHDATKPIMSPCPYCGAGIFSCVLLMASQDLRQLQRMIKQASDAVARDVGRDSMIVGGAAQGKSV